MESLLGQDLENEQCKVGVVYKTAPLFFEISRVIHEKSQRKGKLIQFRYDKFYCGFGMGIAFGYLSKILDIMALV
jgi:hypothetical protein